MVGLFLTVVITSSITLQSLSMKEQKVMQEANLTRYLSFVLADEFRHTSMNLTSLCRTYVATGEQKYWDAYWEIVKWRSGKTPRPDYVNHELYRGKVKEQKEIMKELGFSEKEFTLLQEASKNSNALIATEDQAMKTIQGKAVVPGPMKPANGESYNQFALRIVFDDAYHGEVKKIMAPVDSFFAELDTRTLAKVNSARDKANMYATLALLMQLFVVAVVLGSIYYAIMYILRPVNACVVIAEKVATGDLTVQISVNAEDETGQLMSAIKNMVQNLKDMISQAIDVSQTLASASGKLYSTSGQIASGSEKVASQAGTVATASEEMSATSADIARNCILAAESSEKTSITAAHGSRIVQETIDGMAIIAERVRNIANTVDVLGSRSEQIGEIIGTIEDIADQTNLLALNAAIEAARAGEQGRGFAVVADEVRALAERTTKATKEIGEMIKAIQRETKLAVNSMEEGVQEVEKGATSSQKSGAALIEILDQINDVTIQINQIATAAEEQTTTTGEITSHIHQISEVIQQTAKGADETSFAAAHLAEQAQQLQGLVGRFRIS